MSSPDYEPVAKRECYGAGMYFALGVAAVEGSEVELWHEAVDLGTFDKLPDRAEFYDIVVDLLDHKFKAFGNQEDSGLRTAAAAIIRFCMKRNHDDGTLSDYSLRLDGQVAVDFNPYQPVGARAELARLVVVGDPNRAILPDDVDPERPGTVVFNGFAWRSPLDPVMGYVPVERGAATARLLVGLAGGERFVQREPEPMLLPPNLLEQ